jgi:hypothetical protein
MEIPMWKELIAGTTMLMIAGSTLASAQQPSPAERSHHAQLTADDIAAFTDARFAAIKAALKLTPAQEKNWPAVEQALRDISKERSRRCVDHPGGGAAALGRRREAAVPEPRRGAEAPFRHGHALRGASAQGGGSHARLSAPE